MTSSTATLVRKLTGNDASPFRALHLQALELHPDAFSAALEDEQPLGVDIFAGRLENGEFFGAFVEGKLVAIATYQANTARKRRHMAMIWGVFVEPASRGTGVASRLMAAVLAYAEPRVDQVELYVNASNETARRFYRRFGFEPYGVMRRSLRVDGKDHDAEMMVKIFR